VTVLELPATSQSAKRDVSEEAKQKLIPSSTDSLTSTDLPSPDHVLSVTRSQQPTTEALSNTHIAGNVTATGKRKAWSRALHNLNEAIAKRGQFKEVSFDQEGATNDEVIQNRTKIDKEPSQQTEDNFDKEGATGEVINQSETKKLSPGTMIDRHTLNNLTEAVAKPGHVKKVLDKKSIQEKEVSCNEEDLVGEEILQGETCEVINQSETTKLSAGAMINRHTLNNLTEAITKRGQMKKILDKISVQETEVSCGKEEVAGEEILQIGTSKRTIIGQRISRISAKLQKSGAEVSMPTLKTAVSNWSTLRQKDATETYQDDKEERVDAPGFSDENEDINPKDSSLPGNYERKTLGNQAPALLLPAEEEAMLSTEDACYSDQMLCEDGGSKEKELQREGPCAAIENEKDPVGDFTPEEQEGGNDVEAMGAEGALSPRKDPPMILAELMAVKLELANARTENDHYRRVLKNTESELDMYKDKCTQYEKQSSKTRTRFILPSKKK